MSKQQYRYDKNRSAPIEIIARLFSGVAIIYAVIMIFFSFFAVINQSADINSDFEKSISESNGLSFQNGAKNVDGHPNFDVPGANFVLYDEDFPYEEIEKNSNYSIGGIIGPDRGWETKPEDTCGSWFYLSEAKMKMVPGGFYEVAIIKTERLDYSVTPGALSIDEQISSGDEVMLILQGYNKRTKKAETMDVFYYNHGEDPILLFDNKSQIVIPCKVNRRYHYVIAEQETI